MIETHALTRRFGTFTAVSQVSLRVPDGAILALLGPNGAGKTTTIRMLSGLLAPTEGNATVAGYDIRREADAVRACVGLVTDVPGLFEQMKTPAYLDFFASIYGLPSSERRRRIDELLEFFDLTTHRNEKMAGFSKGMKQKVALARALIHEPAILFLDEPTSGLDPLAARSVRELIVGFKRSNRSIILCTHDLDEAERLADQVAIIRQGHIVALDTPSTLRKQATGETLVQIEFVDTCPLPLEALAAIDGVHNPQLREKKATGSLSSITQPPGSILEYQTPQPKIANPQILSQLIMASAQIVTVTCETRSLEDVYASAMGDVGTSLADVRQQAMGDVETSLVDASWYQGMERTINTMNTGIQSGTTRTTYKKASTLHIMWLIARRQMLEAIRDRSTLMMSGMFLIIQTVLVLISVGPTLQDHTVVGLQRAGFLMAFYLLFVGLMPATPAIGIASGVFAGDKERGCLTPLLVTPASNTAILAGKVLGAVLPALAYAGIGILIYFAEIALLYGPDKLALLPVGLSILIVLLIPGIVLFGTALASVISSRVRTFQSAQNFSSLILVVLWIGLFGLLFLQGILGLWSFAIAVVGVYIIAILFIVISAITWSREEVMARQ